MAGVADLIALREQLSSGAPAQPYIPPKPAPMPTYAPFDSSGGVIPGMTYGANTNGKYSGVVGKGLAKMLGVSPDEDWIIQHESGWNPAAWNKTPVYSGGKLLGHAMGLGQLVDTNRQSYARQLGIKNPDTLDPREQLALFRLYVTQRYQNAANAKQFWMSHGWY